MASPRGHHWVIGDVHGCDDALKRLLAVLPTTDHLVFCGDVINRGPCIANCIDRVWSLVRCGRATWLRGNHEQALIESLHGASTAKAIDLLAIETYHQLGESQTREWLQRLNTLPLAYRGHGWIATHAGFDERGQPDLEIRESFWERYDGRYGTVVVGHTPRPAVEHRGQIVMIDTGAVYGGLLTAFCPETHAVVQVTGQPAEQAVHHPKRNLVVGAPC